MSNERPFFGRETSKFSDAFPDIVSLEMMIVQDRFGQYTKDGQPAERRFTNTTASRRLACVNPRCQQGGLDLQPILSFFPNGEHSLPCNGHEGTPKGRRKGAPCSNTFEVTFMLSAEMIAGNRWFQMRKPLDPRICNIGLDANALDRDGSARDQLVEKFEHLAEAGELNVVLAGGVRNEVLHPHTPTAIKEILLPKIFNLRPRLTSEQNAERQKVLAVLRGNAQQGKHEADASHLSEAAETGCGFFITQDTRILKKRDALRPVLPPLLHIVTLEEFMTILRNKQHGATSPSPVSPAESAHTLDTKSERENERTVAVELIEDQMSSARINAVFRGAYSLAAVEAELAMTPLSKRSAYSARPSDALDFCTRDVLQRALDAARLEPLRPSPHFGPIILADAS